MDIKSLSSRQVRCTQKLSWYHLQINYYQKNTNGAAGTLSCFLQRN